MPQTITDLGKLVKQKYPGSYDQMDDAELGRLVQKKYPGAYDQFTDAPAEKPAAISRAASGFFDQINPVTAVKGMADAVAHPIDTIKGIGQAQGALFDEASAAFKKGDYATAARKALEYAIPVLGPAVSKLGDQAQEGDVAGAVGGAAGLGLASVAPELIRKIPGVKVSPKIATENPVDAAAVALADKEGIPVGANVRTNNQFVRGAQKAVAQTPLGSMVATKAEAATTAGLKRTAGKLADRAYPEVVIPEQAGMDLKHSLQSTIGSLKADADMAYGGFRDSLENPASVRKVPVGKREIVTEVGGEMGYPRRVTKTVDVFESMKMPVDVRSIKTGLAPMYESMSKWMEPAKRNASAGFQAVKSIMEGPDYLPADVAEQGLSGLKSLAREAPSADLRNTSQGIASRITAKLQAKIDTTVAQADSKAFKALQEGRKLHAEKMQMADVLEKVADEPVQAFQQMTWKKDSGIERLRAVAKAAPDEMPKLGRAYLEDLFTKSQAEGGWSKSQTVWSRWQDLGPETKKLMFQDTRLIQDLDSFFTLAKRVADNPNPSGSGTMNIITAQTLGGIVTAPTHPIMAAVGILGPDLAARLLYSPKASKFLMNGMVIPMGDKAAKAAWTAQLSSLAERAKARTESAGQLVPAPAQ